MIVGARISLGRHQCTMLNAQGPMPNEISMKVRHSLSIEH
jgi:hypothetical protein